MTLPSTVSVPLSGSGLPEFRSRVATWPSVNQQEHQRDLLKVHSRQNNAQGCLCLCPWSLWICQVSWQRRVKAAGGIKASDQLPFRQIDCHWLYRWTQYNHKDRRRGRSDCVRRIRLPSVGLGDGRKGRQVKEGGQPLHSGKREEMEFLLTHSPVSHVASVLQRKWLQIHEQHCQTKGLSCLKPPSLWLKTI